MQNPLVFFVIFLGGRHRVGAHVRTAISETWDRGSACRIGSPARCSCGAHRLVAVTMVLIFDRIIPANRQPAFLAGSQLRPILLIAGQRGSSRCRRTLRPTSIQLKGTADLTGSGVATDIAPVME